MSGEMAVLLTLFNALTAWIYVWKLVVQRRVARGARHWLAHGLGALAGVGAAFGAFFFTLSFSFPTQTDHGPEPFWPGVQIGAVILGGYVLGFNAHRRIVPPAFLRTLGYRLHQATHTLACRAATQTTAIRASITRQASLAFAFLRTLAARTGSQIATAWARTLRQMRRAGQVLRAEWAAAMDDVKRQEAQAAARRAAREKALGMPFDEFLAERAAGHFKAWCLAGFMAGWISVFWLMHTGQGSLDWFMSLLLSLILVGMAAMLLALALSIPILLIGLLSETLAGICLFILLPFPLLSVWLEARWRVRRHRPYVPPPVIPVTYDRHHDSAVADATPATCGMYWLVPLALGWWLGSAWAGDDD